MVLYFVLLLFLFFFFCSFGRYFWWIVEQVLKHKREKWKLRNRLSGMVSFWMFYRRYGALYRMGEPQLLAVGFAFVWYLFRWVFVLIAFRMPCTVQWHTHSITYTFGAAMSHSLLQCETQKIYNKNKNKNMKKKKTQNTYKLCKSASNAIFIDTTN